MSARGDSKPLAYVEDTAVDPQKLGAFIKQFDKIVKAHDTEAAYYGHASVGCLHVRPLVNLKTSEGTDKMVSLASEISDLTLEFGGSLSGEHGDGIVRGVWNEKMFGSQLYQAFREVKQAFDPDNIMNPGKIVDSPAMTENLRISPSYRVAQPETALDFSRTSVTQALWRCATGWAPAARRRARCAPPTWSPERRNTPHEAGPTCCGASCPAPCPATGWTANGSMRPWTYAWNAKAARPSARRAWTWPKSSTSSWTTTTAPTAFPCGPGPSQTSTP